MAKRPSALAARLAVERAYRQVSLNVAMQITPGPYSHGTLIRAADDIADFLIDGTVPPLEKKPEIRLVDPGSMAKN
jgi:hypothetical protein